MAELIKKFYFLFSAKSDIGLVRKENQDSFGKFPENNTDLDSPKGQLFIVADGMGGHKGGKEASSIAVKVVNNEYFASSYDESIALKEAIEKANITIFKKSGDKSQFGRMGTTCSVLVLMGNKGIIGHVGDSRIYKIENNFIEQLTTDHTKVQEMLREGILTPEDARNYPSKSVLARALGVEEVVKVDIIDDIRLARGQSYILCSDGLAKVSKGEILNIVTNHSPSDACDILIDLANERGGKDNITAIVIKINPVPVSKIPESGPVRKTIQKPVKRKVKRYSPNRKGWLAVSVIFLIIIILFFVQYQDSVFSSSPGRVVKKYTGQQSTKTFNKDKPKIDFEDTDSKLLDEAHRSLREKDYNNAYIIYKSLLSNKSFRQEALKGLDEIASGYLSYADKLMDSKDFKEALVYYKKAEAIKPEDEGIKSLIKLCTDQLNFNEPLPETIATPNMPSADTKTSPKFTVSRFDLPGWIYPGLQKNECSISSNEITFTGTTNERFIVYNQDLFDLTISAGTEIDDHNSSIGLIIGYVSPLDYYIFKYRDGGNYTLQRIKGNDIEKLLVVKPNNAGESDLRKMKLIYTKNLISIYDQNGLIGSYKSVYGIFGKAGIYVDKNSSAKFKDLSISGDTELK